MLKHALAPWLCSSVCGWPGRSCSQLRLYIKPPPLLVKWHWSSGPHQLPSAKLSISAVASHLHGSTAARGRLFLAWLGPGIPQSGGLLGPCLCLPMVGPCCPLAWVLGWPCPRCGCWPCWYKAKQHCFGESVKFLWQWEGPGAVQLLRVGSETGSAGGCWSPVLGDAGHWC